MAIPKNWRQWGRTLLGGVVSGAANAVLAALGISAANAAGVPVAPLNLNQMVGVFASGGFIGACMFLAKSPIPPDAFDTAPPIAPDKTINDR